MTYGKSIELFLVNGTADSLTIKRVNSRSVYDSFFIQVFGTLLEIIAEVLRTRLL